MPCKLDPHSVPAQKVIQLFCLLLFTGRPHSLGELASLLHCSKQSVLRLIEQVERSKWLTVDSFIKRRQRFYQARTPAQTPNVTLDAEALGRLLLCRDMAWHILPEAYRDETTQALQGASVLLARFDDRADAFDSYTRVKPKGMIDYSDKEALISTIIRAIREHRLCEIVYQGPRHAEPRTYAAAPYELVVFHEGLYLRCRPEAALDPPEPERDLILAVHRMRDVVAGETRFQPVAVQTKAQQLAGSFGLNQGEPFRVKVRVSAGAALYVRERIWSDDQCIRELPEGAVELEFTSTSEPETVAWVLGFGGEVELLEPARLRPRMRECLARMTRHYEAVVEP